MAAIQRIHCQDEDEDMGASTGGDEDMGVSTSSPAGDSIIWSVADSGCVLCLRVDGSERYAVFGGYFSVFSYHIFSDSLAHVGPWKIFHSHLNLTSINTFFHHRKGVDVSLWDLEKRNRIWSAKNVSGSIGMLCQHVLFHI